MIDYIPENQKCEAYDPLLIFPEKTKDILEDHMRANLSCFARAYFYMEGSRGKRFLCDLHYFNEKHMTIQRTPEQWGDICKYLINNAEQIKQTFNYKNDKRKTIPDEETCWCKKIAYVSIRSINSEPEQKPLYLCNFHYRKTYHRYLNHCVDFFDRFIIIDERDRMTISINEEGDQLTFI